MGQSVKAVLQLVLLVLVFAAVLAWGVPRHPDGVVWTFRLGSPVCVALLGWVLVRSTRRREVLPDLLAQATGGYFERDGLCFGFAPARTIDGGQWLFVYFQNRYERLCEARIVLKPPSRNLWFGRWRMTTVDVTVVCDGAAFGVHRTPWPIPAKLQGRSARFDVACRTAYPSGRGKRLRYREGARAGVPGSDLGRAALALGGAAVGTLAISRPARWRIRLPRGSVEGVLPGATASTQILWRPDPPTGGFPVVPIRSE